MRKIAIIGKGYAIKTYRSVVAFTLAAIAFVALSDKAICQNVIFTFDDLPPSGYQIPNGYGGLEWNYFDYEAGFIGGYANAVISPSNIAFNEYGNPASLSINSGLFNLNSAYLTAAWYDGLQVEVQGFTAGTLRYDNTYTVNTGGPALITFDYLGIDEARFSSFGGTLNPDYAGTGDGTNFAMDNLSITVVVPEPSTLTLASCVPVMLAFRRLTRRCQR